MILYKFYKKVSPNVNTSDLLMSEKYPLYAFTTSKKMYKDFKRIRNMDKFHVIKTEIEKSDFVEFANKHNNCKLDYYEYPSIDKKLYEMVDTKVLSTWHERETVDSITSEGCVGNSLDDLNFNILFNPFILKNKWIKFLKSVGYIDFWKIYGNPETFLSSISEDDKNDFLDYDYPDYIIAVELAIFVYLYGDLLK